MARSRRDDQRSPEDAPEASDADRTRLVPAPRGGDEAIAEADAQTNPHVVTSPPRRKRGPAVVDDALDVSPAPKRRRPAPRGPNSDADWEAPPEQDSQATRIGAMPERHKDPDEAAARFAVEVVEGPDRGMRLPIRGERMVVGRGEDCDFRLTDGSTSRRHVELTVNEAGLSVRDLGSGNGTYVNGAKTVESDVAGGDEIAVGDTIFRVVDLANPAKPERKPVKKKGAAEPDPEEEGTDAAAAAAEDEAPGADDGTARMPAKRVSKPSLPKRIPDAGPARKAGLLARFAALPLPAKLLFAGTVVLLLLALIVAAGRGPDKARPSKEAVAAQARDYDAAYQDARKLYLAKKLDAALERAREAQSLRKTIEADRLVATCEEAIKSAGMLAAAKVLASQGEFEKAIDKAKEIEESADEAEEADDLIKKWTAAKIEADVVALRSAVEAGEFERARALLSAVPAERREELRREIDAAEARARADEGRRKQSEKAQAQRRKEAELERLRAELDEALAPVVVRIDAADGEGAVRQCERLLESRPPARIAQRAKLVKKIAPEFTRAYTEANRLYNDGAYEQAAAALMNALKLYEDMDLAGKLYDPLRRKASQAFVFKARAAASRQDWGAAARAYNQALRLSKDSRDARDGLASVRRNAEDVYNEAYAIRERDPEGARKKLRDVLEMVPASDPLAGKARKRLDELDGH